MVTEHCVSKQMGHDGPLKWNNIRRKYHEKEIFVKNGCFFGSFCDVTIDVKWMY